MALQTILDTIVAEAEKQIAELTSAHKQFLKQLNEDSEDRLARKRTQIAELHDQHMRQLKEKTDSQARMTRNKTLLACKQKLMDRLYDEAFKHLVGLPQDKTQALLALCLKQIPGPGVILPAKAHKTTLEKLLPKDCTIGETIDAAGGFRFVSETVEHDFSYEFLVYKLLREQTELSAAEQLFPTVS